MMNKMKWQKPPLRQGAPGDYQTPPIALKPLFPFLKRNWLIWECACGKGYLVDEMRLRGYRVIGSDILTGQDFMHYIPEEFDCIITNPPYKLRNEFLSRCYELRKPFALLMPITTLETAKRQRLFRDFGIELICFDKRIEFEMPENKIGQAIWFGVAWFTNWLDIGKNLSFVRLNEDVIIRQKIV